MPDVSPLALHVWRRNRDVYLNVWRSELIWPFVEPFVTLLALGIGLGNFIQFDEKTDYMAFIGPALIAVYPMWSSAAECAWGSFFRMDQQGTFDAVIATPVSVDEVSTGEILWGGTRGVMGVCYVGVMVLAFGGISSPLAILILPFSILPGIMFSAISLCYTATAKSIGQFSQLLLRHLHHAAVLAVRRILSAGRDARMGGGHRLVHARLSRSPHLSGAGRREPGGVSPRGRCLDHRGRRCRLFAGALAHAATLDQVGPVPLRALIPVICRL